MTASDASRRRRSTDEPLAFLRDMRASRRRERARRRVPRLGPGPSWSSGSATRPLNTPNATGIECLIGHGSPRESSRALPLGAALDQERTGRSEQLRERVCPGRRRVAFAKVHTAERPARVLRIEAVLREASGQRRVVPTGDQLSSASGPLRGSGTPAGRLPPRHPKAPPRGTQAKRLCRFALTTGASALCTNRARSATRTSSGHRPMASRSLAGRGAGSAFGGPDRPSLRSPLLCGPRRAIGLRS